MLKSLLQWSVWPACLATNMAPVITGAILVPQLVPQIAAATTIVLMSVLLVVEQLLPHRADWAIGGDCEVWRDIGHSVAYSAAVNASRVLFLVSLGSGISALGLSDLFGLWPSSRSVWLQIVIVIMLGDFLEYLYHRLSHSYAFLWRLHALHHTSVRLHALKGARHHVLYAFGRGVAVWLPLLVVGAPAGLVYWQFIAVTIAGLTAHANVSFTIPAFMHRLAVTPEFHRIHHAADPKLGNTNFGVVFSVWDMLFGTHSDPLKIVVGETGIDDDPIPRRFLEELRSPVTYATLVARRRDEHFVESASASLHERPDDLDGVAVLPRHELLDAERHVLADVETPLAVGREEMESPDRSRRDAHRSPR